MKYSLVGVDSNANYIMKYVADAMRENDIDEEQIDEYLAEAKSDDYEHLLYVSLEMVDWLNKECAEDNKE